MTGEGGPACGERDLRGNEDACFTSKVAKALPLPYLEVIEQRKALGVARLLETFDQLPDLRRQIKKRLEFAVDEVRYIRRGRGGVWRRRAAG